MLKMLGSLLLALLILPSALPQYYTIFSENTVTARSTTTSRHDPNGFLRIASKATVTKRKQQEGLRICQSTAKAGLTINVTGYLVREGLEDLLIHADKLQCNRQQALYTQLREVLGQLQEVRENLHSRPERSAGANRVCETVHNATRALSKELETVKNRQAVAAALSTFQLFMFITYMVVKIVLYIIQAVKKHNARRIEEELELMESRLASRKAKRRSAAARAKDRSSPTSPTQQWGGTESPV